MTAHFPPVPLPDSPFAADIQACCVALDGAYEDYPWGQVAYKVGTKMFAAFSGLPVDATNPLRLTLKATLDDQAALVQFSHIEPASYVGRYGWITVRITGPDTLAHALELIEQSYALVAPKRARRRL
jgi:predicted DNA-binding protein (MmcQ/YjbR family)